LTEQLKQVQTSQWKPLQRGFFTVGCRGSWRELSQRDSNGGGLEELGPLGSRYEKAVNNRGLFRVPPPVPFAANQRLKPFGLPENDPSFNKSFNTSPRVSLVLNASHHAIKRGDGARSLPAVSMVIPQLEGIPRCSFNA
jgi:hypothetical protein